MGSDQLSDSGGQNTSRLRESVSMAIRQYQRQPQPARTHSNEIPESDEGEAEALDDRDDNEEERGRALKDPSPGRHSASSAAPSSKPDEHSLQAEPNSQEQADTPPAFPPPSNTHLCPHPNPPPPLFSPSSTVPPTPTTTTNPNWPPASSPLKRSLSPSSRGPPSPRPFKRRRAAPFHHAYLALLNDDIRDAATRYIPPPPPPPHPPPQHGGDDDMLAPSQLGMTVWSGAEKALFFEAVARVGIDDLSRIAGRVKTKGKIEVAAYVAALREAAVKEEVAGSSGRVSSVEPMGMAGLPAAVEVGPACCAALEEAADAVSVRQEGYEEGVERRRWGGDHWLVGAGNWRALEKDVPEGMEGSLKLFRVGAWLRLSERVFMNSAVEEYNWARVEAEQPAVRATALGDFYTLAVAVTRRLVAATVFVAEGRVKAKRELDPYTKSLARKRDVQAAALSLGLPTDRRRFWARSARRLRLDVYDDENGVIPGWDAGDEQEPMTYDEVEAALGLEPEGSDGGTPPDEETDSSEEDRIDDDVASESDRGSIELGAGAPHVSDYEEQLSEEDEAEKLAVTREMNEILVHSAFEYPKTGKPRAALRNRIRAERAHEAYADKLDARESYYEEKRLWAMLGRQPPVKPVKPDVPEEPLGYTKQTVGDLINTFARAPGDWRNKLEVVPSKWEMDFAVAEEEKVTPKVATGTVSGDEI